MNTLTLNFEFDRETKNTVRYAEKTEQGQERPIIGTIYVLKSKLPDVSPKSLTVTIEAGN